MGWQVKEYWRYTWQMLTGFRARHERMFAEMRSRDIAPYVTSPGPLRVLDVANGWLRPQYTILKADGHHVYGIDLVNHPAANLGGWAHEVARWLYIHHLGAARDKGAANTLVQGNVAALPYPDDSFDLVTSVAAFEHFLKVPAVVAELKRVLRPGGVVWVLVHLFTCPSGGHNVTLTEIPMRHVPRGIDPWDHLRLRRLPFHVPLNEWRSSQYLEVFSQNFEIIRHYCAMREGEQLLTPEIEKELADYSRDELTCGSYVIVARRPIP